MTDYTAEQYRAAARKALAAGDTASAQKLIEAGMALGQAAPVAQPAGRTDGWSGPTDNEKAARNADVDQRIKSAATSGAPYSAALGLARTRLQG